MYCNLWAEISFSALMNDISLELRDSLPVCLSAQRRSADRSERPRWHSAADPQSADHLNGAGHGKAPMHVSVLSPDIHAWLDSWFLVRSSV